MDAPPLKRNRVPLSCNHCRASKQKCDRTRPACTQCLRRGQPAGCRYADRPARPRHGRGVAARLQRLEGMVRGMMDEGEGEGEANGAGAGGGDGDGDAPGSERVVDERTGEEEGAVGGRSTVVSGRRATSYVGATHFMAILEDVSRAQVSTALTSHDHKTRTPKDTPSDNPRLRTSRATSTTRRSRRSRARPRSTPRTSRLSSCSSPPASSAARRTSSASSRRRRPWTASSGSTLAA